MLPASASDQKDLTIDEIEARLFGGNNSTSGSSGSGSGSDSSLSPVSSQKLLLSGMGAQRSRKATAGRRKLFGVGY